jgi:hypothetical protein
VNRENGPAAPRRVRILDALHESFDGDTPEPSRILIDDGHRGSQGRRHGKVTEPDHSDIGTAGPLQGEH